MSDSHKILLHETGHLRIYMTRGERLPLTGWRKFFSKPLFRHLIHIAKKEGIPHATAHSTHYGFVQKEDVESIHAEQGNERIAVFVELTAGREQLEQFVTKHGNLLRNKEMVYKHLERWELSPTPDLHDHVFVTADRTSS